MNETRVTVASIVKEWLKSHGYDGLCYKADCGCGLDGLMPCGDDCSCCEPAYEHIVTGQEDDVSVEAEVGDIYYSPEPSR